MGGQNPPGVCAFLRVSPGGSDLFVRRAGGNRNDACPAADGPLRLELEQVVTGLANPVDLQEAPDGPGWLFVVEQRGTIRIIQATVNPRFQLIRQPTDS